MDINAKYSIAHSHAWAMGRIYAVLFSELQIYTCALMYCTVPYLAIEK